MVLQIANLTLAKDALNVRYAEVDRVKEAQLQTSESEFESPKMNATESLDVYVGKISGIASQQAVSGIHRMTRDWFENFWVQY